MDAKPKLHSQFLALMKVSTELHICSQAGKDITPARAGELSETIIDATDKIWAAITAASVVLETGSTP